MPSEIVNRRLIAGVVVLAVGTAGVLLFMQYGNFGSLTGQVTQRSFNGFTFDVATDIAHGENISIDPGEHTLVTCPVDALPNGYAWNGPADFSLAQGLKVYEFSNGYTEEVAGNWNGFRTGYNQLSGETLQSFFQGKTYYVKADNAFDFRCSTQLQSSSSSSSSSSDLSTISLESSSSEDSSSEASSVSSLSSDQSSASSSSQASSSSDGGSTGGSSASSSESSSEISSSSALSSSSLSSSSIAAVCGNAIVEPPEQCDDGNTNEFDGCFTTCILSIPPYPLP